MLRKISRITAGWTTEQAAKLAGLPAKTVHNWIERDVIKPRVAHGRGRGRGYRFTDTDVVGLSLMARLRKDGVSLQRLRPTLTQLRKHTGRDSNLSALANAQLVFMDKKLHVLGSGDELVDLLTGQHLMQPILCPPLSGILQEIRERAKQDETLQQRLESLDAGNILLAA